MNLNFRNEDPAAKSFLNRLGKELKDDQFVVANIADVVGVNDTGLHLFAENSKENGVRILDNRGEEIETRLQVIQAPDGNGLLALIDPRAAEHPAVDHVLKELRSHNQTVTLQYLDRSKTTTDTAQSSTKGLRDPGEDLKCEIFTKLSLSLDHDARWNLSEEKFVRGKYHRHVIIITDQESTAREVRIEFYRSTTGFSREWRYGGAMLSPSLAKELNKLLSSDSEKHLLPTIEPLKQISEAISSWSMRYPKMISRFVRESGRELGMLGTLHKITHEIQENPKSEAPKQTSNTSSNDEGGFGVIAALVLFGGIWLIPKMIDHPVGRTVLSLIGGMVALGVVSYVRGSILPKRRNRALGWSSETDPRVRALGLGSDAIFKETLYNGHKCQFYMAFCPADSIVESFKIKPLEPKIDIVLDFFGRRTLAQRREEKERLYQEGEFYQGRSEVSLMNYLLRSANAAKSSAALPTLANPIALFALIGDGSGWQRNDGAITKWLANWGDRFRDDPILSSPLRERDAAITFRKLAPYLQNSQNPLTARRMVKASEEYMRILEGQRETYRSLWEHTAHYLINLHKQTQCREVVAAGIRAICREYAESGDCTVQRSPRSVVFHLLSILATRDWDSWEQELSQIADTASLNQVGALQILDKILEADPSLIETLPARLRTLVAYINPQDIYLQTIIAIEWNQYSKIEQEKHSGATDLSSKDIFKDIQHTFIYKSTNYSHLVANIFEGIILDDERASLALEILTEKVRHLQQSDDPTTEDKETLDEIKTSIEECYRHWGAMSAFIGRVILGDAKSLAGWKGFREIHSMVGWPTKASNQLFGSLCQVIPSMLTDSHAILQLKIGLINIFQDKELSDRITARIRELDRYQFPTTQVKTAYKGKVDPIEIQKIGEEAAKKSLPDMLIWHVLQRDSLLEIAREGIINLRLFAGYDSSETHSYRPPEAQIAALEKIKAVIDSKLLAAVWRKTSTPAAYRDWALKILRRRTDEISLTVIAEASADLQY